MNRRIIIPLMVIGLCSSMLFGCENNDTKMANLIIESDSVEVRIEGQEIKKPAQYGRIRSKKCVMRSEPSRMSTKLSFLSINDTVEIISENDTVADSCSWNFVKYGDKTGYVRTSDLEVLHSVVIVGIEEPKKNITRIGSSENFNVSQPADEFQKVESNSFFYLLPEFMLIIITIFILFIYWRKMIKKRTNKVEISLETKENVMKDESNNKSVQIKKEISSYTTNKREFSLETKKALMKDGFDSLSDQLWVLFKTVEGTLNEMVVELQKRVNVLEEELAKTRLRLKEVSIQVKEKDEEKMAIKVSEGVWRKKCDTLSRQNEELKQQTDQYKHEMMKKECDIVYLKTKLDSTEKNLHEEINDRKKVVDELHQLLTDRDHLINRLQIEAKFYTKKVVFLPSTQTFAQRAMAFFDTLDQLLGNINRLKMNVPSSVNADDYNYYLIRIERKFYAFITKLENLSQWRFELQLLAQQEIVPASGLIDKKMGGGKVKENEWERMLRMLFYQDIMSTLAGAAVVMSDELALMLPQMVSGVSGTDEFAKITEKLRKVIADMGYELNYVKPFTRFDGYKDVQNVKYTEADVPQGTIFEVLKMALNYESYMTKTEVSAK